MSRYETYKPSGIDWIGEVPDNWKIIRVKGNCYVKGRIGWQELRAEEFVDEGIHCVTGTDFKNQFVNWDTCYRVSLERYLIDDNIQLKEGDVLITKDGTIGKTAIVKDMPEKATLNSGIFLVRPEKAKLENEYLYWILNSKVFEDYNDFTKTGATILHLYQNVFVEMHFPLPDNDEQLAIANYLHDQTQKIDRLIANKKVQAENLKELRQIEINNAVTKGLNPNAEMKDSGIEWLGKIPKHWEVKRLKNCFYIKGRIGWQELKAEEFQDTGAYCVTGTDFNNGKVEWTTCYRVSYERWAIDDNITLSENDLLITKDGTIGKVAVVKDMPDKATLNSGIFLLRSLKSQISTDYFYWVLISNCLTQFNDYTKTGSTISHLYQNVFVDFKFNLPPIEEQIQITNFLQQRTTAIDQLIKNIEAQIEKLQELRKIKTYEAVTGKIKVNAYAETTA